MWEYVGLGWVEVWIGAWIGGRGAGTQTAAQGRGKSAVRLRLFVLAIWLLAFLSLFNFEA